MKDFFQSGRRDFGNFLFWFDEKGHMEIEDGHEYKIEGKSRQNSENKQTFDLSGKIEIKGKNSSKH